MKYIILQNTTAPYRTSLFNNLYSKGLDIYVLYMCELEKERSWKVDYNKFSFPYYIDKGYDFYPKGFSIHWNPRLIKMMVKDKNSVIILGGAWNALDVIAMCILKRIGLVKQEIIFWSEANYLSNGSRKRNRFRDTLRSFVYNTGEGRVIVPGKMSEITFKKWGITNKKFIHLPNVIEEELCSPLYFENRTYSPFTELPRFIMPVRLSERIKGIINFFKAIGQENIRKAIFEILGDGEDEYTIKKFIKDNGYDNNIILRGFCPMDVVIEYYKKCDALILPSFSDQSPLCLVEACCARLPLLVSNRCGNHYETVEDGKNGFLFNPDNHQMIKNAYLKLMDSRKIWPEMGKLSYKHFKSYFKQDVVLDNFILEIQQN